MILGSYAKIFLTTFDSKNYIVNETTLDWYFNTYCQIEVNII